MKDLQIIAPIFTLEGKELLPGGAIVNDETIKQVIAANPDTYANIRLFEHGTVLSDIQQAMAHPPYDHIFADNHHADQTLNLLQNVEVIQPVLDSLDYFKANDFHTYRHILMVYILSCFFGKFLIVDFENHIQEIVGWPTHDFGKINVPLSILLKKEPLTRTELALLHHHAIAGYCLLCYYYQDPENHSALLARDHHERRNGQGYPFGVTRISPLVELVIVSDVYDALISPRCYRPESFDNRSALEVITKMAEKGEIGWEIVKLLASQNRTEKPDYKTLEISLEKRGQAPDGNNYGIIIDDNEPKALL